MSKSDFSLSLQAVELIQETHIADTIRTLRVDLHAGTPILRSTLDEKLAKSLCAMTLPKILYARVLNTIFRVKPALTLWLGFTFMLRILFLDDWSLM